MQCDVTVWFFRGRLTGACAFGVETMAYFSNDCALATGKRWWEFALAQASV